MMEQGGNTLIGRLIDDLQCEHVEHEDAMNVFRARLAALSGVSSLDPALQQLVQAVDDLANELASHMRAKDDGAAPCLRCSGLWRLLRSSRASPYPLPTHDINHIAFHF